MIGLSWAYAWPVLSQRRFFLYFGSLMLGLYLTVLADISDTLLGTLCWDYVKPRGAMLPLYMLEELEACCAGLKSIEDNPALINTLAC